MLHSARILSCGLVLGLLLAAPAVNPQLRVDALAPDGASVLFTYERQVLFYVPRYFYSAPAVTSATDADGDSWLFAFTVRPQEIILEYGLDSAGTGDIEPFTIAVGDLDEGRPIQDVVVNSPIPLDVSFTATRVTIRNVAPQTASSGVIIVQLIRRFNP